MANPYAPLIRMVELRIARQETALSESKLQLDAAKVASAEWEDDQKQLALGDAGGGKQKR